MNIKDDIDEYLQVWMWKFLMDNGVTDGRWMEKMGGNVIRKTLSGIL